MPIFQEDPDQGGDDKKTYTAQLIEGGVDPGLSNYRDKGAYPKGKYWGNREEPLKR